MNEAPSTAFTPKIERYAERVRASFARQGAMALIGAQLTAVGPGYAAIELVPRPELSQQHGYVHAGILAALADSAGGYAGYTLFPEDSSVLTVEYKLNLLAPAAGDRLEAIGTVLRPGRTLSICRLEVFAVSDAGRKLVAAGQQTLISVPGEDGP